ncbi:ABC transporter permease [Aeromicrobium piscarium]|uniref:FtsX-like permease family protein n=1 Tax=Aeromicrobium piscarium TaxID=2590901 RepID=A0A554RX96_9ACTN|nr:ABC transporter permease [Aeromicrobium piscarium]TSD58718.1 FtsX-like permease family protein [Aeromicrobium piscarium]
MFVALRDLRFATGRFALMTTVIVLVSFLVGFLASLTSGLARESTSAITDLPTDRLAFATRDGQSPDFTSSSVTAEDVDAWASTPGVDSAEALGIATTRASAGDTTASVTTFAAEPGSTLVDTEIHDGSVVLTPAAAEDLGHPDTVTIGEQTFEVADASIADTSYAHTPVVWMTLDDWQPIGAPGGSGDTATVVAIDGTPEHTIDDMTTLDLRDARSAISSFSSENGSLMTMQAFLVAISALVVGAFFSVWTMSRGDDIAVLKALGGSTRYLLRDAIGQAVLVLVIGVGAGMGLSALTSALLDGVLPVSISLSTTLAPAALLVGVGLIGAGLAVWRITRIDPHAALAAR